MPSGSRWSDVRAHPRSARRKSRSHALAKHKARACSQSRGRTEMGHEACELGTLPNSLGQFTHELDRVRVTRRLVFAVALDPGKAQREAPRISGALLQPVEGDLDHDFG